MLEFTRFFGVFLFFSSVFHLCCKSAFHVSSVENFISLGVCLCIWPPNCVIQGALWKEPCKSVRSYTLFWPSFSLRRVVFFLLIPLQGAESFWIDKARGVVLNWSRAFLKDWCMLFLYNYPSWLFWPDSHHSLRNYLFLVARERGWKKHLKHVSGACVFHILVWGAPVWLFSPPIPGWYPTWSSQLSNIWADKTAWGLKKNKTPSNFGHCEFDLYVNVNYINIFNRICPRGSTHKQSLSLIHFI